MTFYVRSRGYITSNYFIRKQTLPETRGAFCKIWVNMIHLLLLSFVLGANYRCCLAVGDQCSLTWWVTDSFGDAVGLVDYDSTVHIQCNCPKDYYLELAYRRGFKEPATIIAEAESVNSTNKTWDFQGSEIQKIQGRELACGDENVDDSISQTTTVVTYQICQPEECSNCAHNEVCYSQSEGSTEQLGACRIMDAEMCDYQKLSLTHYNIRAVCMKPFQAVNNLCEAYRLKFDDPTISILSEMKDGKYCTKEHVRIPTLWELTDHNGKVEKSLPYSLGSTYLADSPLLIRFSQEDCDRMGQTLKCYHTSTNGRETTRDLLPGQCHSGFTYDSSLLPPEIKRIKINCTGKADKDDPDSEFRTYFFALKSGIKTQLEARCKGNKVGCYWKNSSDQNLHVRTMIGENNSVICTVQNWAPAHMCFQQFSTHLLRQAVLAQFNMPKCSQTRKKDPTVKDKGSDKAWLVAAIVVSLLLLIMIAAVAVFIIIRRRSSKQEKPRVEQKNSRRELITPPMATPEAEEL